MLESQLKGKSSHEIGKVKIQRREGNSRDLRYRYSEPLKPVKAFRAINSLLEPKLFASSDTKDQQEALSFPNSKPND